MARKGDIAAKGAKSRSIFDALTGWAGCGAGKGGVFFSRAFLGAGTLLFNARFEVQGIAVRR